MRADRSSITAASHVLHERRRRKELEKPGSRSEVCMLIFFLSSFRQIWQNKQSSDHLNGTQVKAWLCCSNRPRQVT